MRGLDCDGRLLKSEPKSCVCLIHTSKDSLAQLPTSFTFNQYSFSVNWSYELTHHNWCIYIFLSLSLSLSLSRSFNLSFSLALCLSNIQSRNLETHSTHGLDLLLKTKKGQGSIDRLPFILWLKSCPACLIKLARPNKLQSSHKRLKRLLMSERKSFEWCYCSHVCVPKSHVWTHSLHNSLLLSNSIEIFYP